MPHAFISYSRSDSKDFAERLAAALDAAGGRYLGAGG